MKATVFLLFVGMSLQAMDSSHVCLISVDLNADGFEPYRCDRNITLGINMKTFVTPSLQIQLLHDKQ